MKKIRLAMIAAATLLGIGGAMANKIGSTVKGQTYFVTAEDAGSWTVSLNQPVGENCHSMPNLACTITSTDAPDSITKEIPKGDGNSSVKRIGEYR